jgi:TrmH family RNA methyltransferase
LHAAAHPLARQARLLARGPRERRAEGLFLVEGPRGLGEALAAGVRPAWVLVSSELVDGGRFDPLLSRCVREGIVVQPVRGALLDRLVPTEQGQGIAAACPLPDGADSIVRVVDPPRDGLVVVASALQNPGNLGALVRSAAAFGARGVISAGGADPWNPKCVRAAAGAIHRLPVARVVEDVPSELALRGYRLIAAVPRGGAAPDRVDWSGRAALVLGSEVAGVPEALMRGAVTVTIPVRGDVESLSVGIAGSLLLFVSSGGPKSA